MPALRGLYAITDERLTDESRTPAGRFADAVSQALQGGARVVQYRDKSTDHGKRLRQAGVLRQLCDRHDALLIINDDIELAYRCSADGVHLGEHDAGLEQARARLGDHAVVGLSCYNRFELAESAQQQGADYIAFGAFFASPTKPDAAVAGTELLQRGRNELGLPVCAIGGITTQNGGALVEAGADMLAVISGVFAQHNIRHAAAQFSRLFG